MLNKVITILKCVSIISVCITIDIIAYKYDNIHCKLEFQDIVTGEISLTKE